MQGFRHPDRQIGGEFPTDAEFLAEFRDSARGAARVAGTLANAPDWNDEGN
jgi:hypothetical protein